MFQFILLALFAIAGLVLGVLNSQSVPFNTLTGTWHVPLSILLALALGCGMLLTGLLLGGRMLAYKWKLKKLKRKLERCEADKLALKQQRLMENHKPQENKNLPSKPHA